MSEYQFYDFLAIDRPLDKQQQAELRELSTRAVITATSFTNSYEWGDLKAEPMAMVEEYFDAHLYFANWGTRQLALRLPLRLLDLTTAQQYCWAEPAEAYQSDDHLILNFTSTDEDSDDSVDRDGEGWLADIVGIRDQLAVGDHRALYLAWLFLIQGGEFGDEATEPPVPAGLGRLTGPLREFAEFLRIDPDLIAAAAQASAPVTAQTAADSADSAELADWVAGLPTEAKDTALVELLCGDGPTVTAELRRRFRADTGKLPDNTVTSRTIGQLLDIAESLRS
ncbi:MULTISPECIES: hypothetical protein [unclassified Solwaraspora]|uniref:hypothetical protein n=1 Tax=unclassified Solwaraspora TaxID=2627926 RepID=UPI00259B1186|nr:hypothetical protein [Solwaraspora sp. WMMA2056]WJK40496.1 hypothetical protein O7608_29575 [Solwaraspora sp. WMMA2056]